MNQVERQLGNILVDFVNAPTSDEACRKHFAHMQSLMSFSPNFPMLAEKSTPLLSHFKPLSENRELIDLIRFEQSIRSEIKEQLECVNLVLSGINYENEQLLVATVYYGGDFVEGKPDVNISFSDSLPITIGELKDEIGDEIGKALRSDFFQQLQKLMKIGCELLKMRRTLGDARLLKDSFLEDLVEADSFRSNITGLQLVFRKLLEHIFSKKRLTQIPQFLALLDRYNKSLKKSKLVIVGDSLLTESPPISESDYFGGYKKLPSDISLPRESFITERIKDDITYCLVEFVRNPKNIDFVRICSCNNYFVASKLDPRIKKCASCSRKSTMSKEERRLYQQKWRARKKAKRDQQKREERIQRMMSAGRYTRKEALKFLKLESKGR